MENILTRSVHDIPESSRRSLEGLLGRELQSDQQVVIVVLDSNSAVSDAARSNAAVGLREIIAQAQRHADQQGISEAEIDAAVDEAMAHVRRRAV